MDGRGCWRDNVFVERLWRSVKCEEVYLNAYDSVSAAPERSHEHGPSRRRTIPLAECHSQEHRLGP
jgi:hypothetical protein